MGGLAGWMYYKEYTSKKDEITEAKKVGNISTGSLESERDFACFLCIVCWSFAGVWLFVILCCYHKISLVIHVIKAAARFINNNICVLFVPLFQVLIGLVIFIIWLLGQVFIYTSGTLQKNTSGYPWSESKQDETGTYIFRFNCFSILWMIAYIVMMQVFVIAAAACVWYFQQGDAQSSTNKSKRNPLCTAYCWAFT